MQLAFRWRVSVALVVCLGGCGPAVSESDVPSWILGTFSTGIPNVANAGVTRYSFVEDHTVVIERESPCEGRPFEWTMLWEAQGKETIMLREAPGEDPFPATTHHNEHTFEKLADCSRVRYRSLRDDGTIAVEGDLFRGALCTQRQPPCEPPGSQCDTCMLTWCDEEPPPCDAER